MKSIFCVVLLAAFISVSYAAVSFGNFTDEANPGKCSMGNGLILSAGEEAKDPNSCALIVCGDEGMAQIQSCGVEGYPDECKAGDYLDLTRPYPDCCEREVICS